MTMSNNIDQEWANFISSGYDDDMSSDDENIIEIINIKTQNKVLNL